MKTIIFYLHDSLDQSTLGLLLTWKKSQKTMIIIIIVYKIIT